MKDVVETVQFNPKNSVGFGSSQDKMAHIWPMALLERAKKGEKRQ